MRGRFGKFLFRMLKPEIVRLLALKGYDEQLISDILDALGMEFDLTEKK